jgi:hypothetical protein
MGILKLRHFGTKVLDHVHYSFVQFVASHFTDWAIPAQKPNLPHEVTVTTSNIALVACQYRL